MSTELDGLFDGFNTELDPNAKHHNRPDLGRGVYMLARYYVKPTFKQGNILIAELIVAQPAPGTTRAPGDKVSLAWYPAKTGLAGQYEKARAALFVTGLLGLPPKSDAGAAAKRLRADDQPGTGIALVITGEPNGEYRNYTFDHIPGQTGEVITANRAKVLAMMAANAPANAGAPTHPNNPANAAAPAVPFPTAPVAPTTAPIAAIAPPAAAPAAAPAAGSPLSFLGLPF